MKLDPPNHNDLSKTEDCFSHGQSKVILDWLMAGSYILDYLESQVIEVCLLQLMASNPTQTLMSRCPASKKEKEKSQQDQSQKRTRRWMQGWWGVISD